MDYVDLQYNDSISGTTRQNLVCFADSLQIALVSLEMIDRISVSISAYSVSETISFSAFVDSGYNFTLNSNDGEYLYTPAILVRQENFCNLHGSSLERHDTYVEYSVTLYNNISATATCTIWLAILLFADIRNIRKYYFSS